jgi:DNA polymerase elongation subunit (family B)
MANVCLVPLPFIFMRGQGIKIFSLVAKRCRDDGFLVPTRARYDGEADGEEEGYEGAIVLEPETGMYLDDPVSVLDYNSLYPSSMISHNLSHDTLVIDAAYGDLPGVTYVDVAYDRFEGKGDEKRRVGQHVCRYAQPQARGAPQPAKPAVAPDPTL